MVNVLNVMVLDKYHSGKETLKTVVEFVIYVKEQEYVQYVKGRE